MSTHTCQTCGYGNKAVRVIVDNFLTDPESLAYNGGLPYPLDDEGYSQVGALLCERCAEVAEEVGYTLADYLHVPLDTETAGV